MFFKRRTYFLVAGSIIGLSILTVVCRSAVARQMNEWQLLPHSEHVTELYFTNYHDIPSPDSSDLTQTVAFTVYNIEHRTTMYHYEITVRTEADKKDHLIDRGDFTLAQGHSLTTSKNITFVTSGKRSIVKVNLAYEGVVPGVGALTAQKQSIHYWFNGNEKKL